MVCGLGAYHAAANCDGCITGASVSIPFLGFCIEKSKEAVLLLQLSPALQGEARYRGEVPGIECDQGQGVGDRRRGNA